jgi:site-specific DNA recombinase
LKRILFNIQFSNQTIKLLRFVLEKLFAFKDLERKNSLIKIEEKMKNLQTQKQFIQSEYMNGLLATSEYQELKKSIDVKLFENEQNQRHLSEVMTPYNEYLNKHVPMFEDLLSFYKKVDGKTKKKILGCIFSKKLHFENKKVATPSFTPPIEILVNVGRVLDSNKKEKETISDLLFNVAPSLGLEPRTL